MPFAQRRRGNLARQALGAHQLIEYGFSQLRREFERMGRGPQPNSELNVI
jgi:hypothetical protein